MDIFDTIDFHTRPVCMPAFKENICLYFLNIPPDLLRPEIKNMVLRLQNIIDNEKKIICIYNIYIMHIKYLCESILDIKLYKHTEQLFEWYNATCGKILLLKILLITSTSFELFISQFSLQVKQQNAAKSPSIQGFYFFMFLNSGIQIFELNEFLD